MPTRCSLPRRPELIQSAASVICVDIIVRLFPGKGNFRVQDSNAFLSASLSLSFGVMVRCPLVTLHHVMLNNSQAVLVAV